MLKVQTLKSASRIKMSAWCASAPGTYFHLCATSPKSQTPNGRTWGVPSWGVGTGSPASLWDRGRATFSRSALGDWVEDRDTKGMPIARRSAITCKHTTRTSIIQVRRSSFHSLCYISDWSARQGQICMEQEHWPSWISFVFFLLRVLIWVRETRNIFLDF